MHLFHHLILLLITFLLIATTILSASVANSQIFAQTKVANQGVDFFAQSSFFDTHEPSCSISTNLSTQDSGPCIPSLKQIRAKLYSESDESESSESESETRSDTMTAPVTTSATASASASATATDEGNESESESEQ